MALSVNEKALIEGSFVEWERLEYKKGFQPEEILHTICAFANDINNWGGGYIIIGIAEKNGRPVLPPEGLKKEQIDSIQKKLVELSYKIQPHFTPVIQPYEYKGKPVLIIWAPGGDIRPYKAPDSLNEKRANLSYYIRKASVTVKARGEDERRLLMLSAKIPFDDRINHNAEITDLDDRLVSDFLKTINSGLYKEIGAISFNDLCERMNILRGPKEYKKPVNIGLLLFSRTPEKFFRGAVIEVIIYHDEVGDKLTEKIFKGPLHNQLKDALNYIQQNIITEEVQKVKGQAEAERCFNYPYEAIEEALANAVYHRSYELQNTIEVNIRQDRIEIISYPGPLPPIDKEMLKKNRIVSRDYRNRRIGDFLKELKLTEGRSTGIPKIRKAMKRNGSPEPVFETDDDRNYFLTILPICSLPQATGEVTGQVTGQVAGQVKRQPESRIESQPESSTSTVPVRAQSATQLPTQSTEQVTGQVSKEILQLLKSVQGEMARKEIQKILNLQGRANFEERYLKPAMNNGMIEYTIPDKPNSRLQKYRLTKKGKEYIEKKGKTCI